MAWNYDQGHRDIRTIRLLCDVSSGDLLYYSPDGNNGLVGVAMTTDTSGDYVGFCLTGAWMFDTTIQFAVGQDVYFHPEAGYHAHMMCQGYLTDSAADTYIGKCVRAYEAGYNTSYESGGGFVIIDLAGPAQGR